MKSSTIEFVNHASVIISYDEISILSDPWYKGTVFNNGWKLIHELEDTKIYDVIKKITHIYISHEHPDHFSPTFFLDPNVKDILIKKRIEILFQKTEDKRVVNFLKKEGFFTNEINSNENKKLNKDIEIKIIRHDFYDSSLILKTPELKILNLNDCPLRSKNEINKFKKKYGNFDVLLTQFSYAAWKGGVKNQIYRKKAAEEKLETIEKQASILNCKSIIPFASFVYFSNELNHYMNDSINTPETVTKFFSSNKNNVVILSPGEIQDLKHLKQNQSSLEFWKKEYANIRLKKRNKFNSTIQLEELSKQFNIYQKKIFKKNSRFLIYILNRIKIMNFFQTLKIKLVDHNKIYLYSIFDGLTETFDNTKYDIEMHSESLFFVFKNEFGFDTLTVNGCFDASRLGFAKTTKSLAIGSLNSMDLHLNLSLIFNVKIILLFLGKLKNVLNRIT